MPTKKINQLLEEHQKLVDLFNELNDIGEDQTLYDMLVTSNDNEDQQEEKSKQYPSLLWRDQRYRFVWPNTTQSKNRYNCQSIKMLGKSIQQYYTVRFLQGIIVENGQREPRFYYFFEAMKFSIQLIETLNMHFKDKTDLTTHEQELYKNIQQKITIINKLKDKKTTELSKPLLKGQWIFTCNNGEQLKLAKPKNLKEELSNSTFIIEKATLIDQQMKQPFEERFAPTPSSDKNAENIVNAKRRRSQTQQNAEDRPNLKPAEAKFTKRQRKVNGVMLNKLDNKAEIFRTPTDNTIRDLLFNISTHTPLSFSERFAEATKHNWKKLAFAGLALIGAGSLVAIQNPIIFVKGNFKEFISNNLVSLCFWALTALALALTLKSWTNGMHGRAYVLNPNSSMANNVVAIHLPEPGEKISPSLARLLGIND